ncbi:MAG: hypothetical protein HY696_05165 [Deltaproteobacteria bacterium]|nr:hypothetical protein [Deltaproteobacteria bacterium]
MAEPISRFPTPELAFHSGPAAAEQFIPRLRRGGGSATGFAVPTALGAAALLATGCQETPTACRNAIQAAQLEHLAPESCAGYAARDSVVQGIPWLALLAVAVLAARSKTARGIVARVRAQHDTERVRAANRSEIAVVQARVREYIARQDKDSLIVAASHLAGLDTAYATIGDAEARERTGLGAAILYFLAVRAGASELAGRPALMLEQLATGLDEQGEALRAQRTRVFEHFFRTLAGDPHAHLQSVLTIFGTIAHGEQTPDALIGWFSEALRAVGIPHVSESPFARLPQLLHEPPTPKPTSEGDRFSMLELE